MYSRRKQDLEAQQVRADGCPCGAWLRAARQLAAGPLVQSIGALPGWSPAGAASRGT